MAGALGQFPRLQKRGPIEAIQFDLSARASNRFHAYKSVAPLKPTDAPSRRAIGGLFPRLQKRGPIEALSQAHLCDTHFLRFPRLQKRGPIEAARTTIAPPYRFRVSTLTKAWPH